MVLEDLLTHPSEGYRGFGLYGNVSKYLVQEKLHYLRLYSKLGLHGRQAQHGRKPLSVHLG